MPLDLYQDEAQAKLTDLPPVQNPTPGAFDGFIRGTGEAVMKGFAKTGRAVSMLGAVGPIAVDAFTGGTEAQDIYFKGHEQLMQRAVDYWTPRPNEVGWAADVVGSLISTLPTVMASPGLAVAGAQLDAGEELVRKGVPAAVAQAVGGLQGASFALGIWMPFLGNTLTSRVATGAIGNLMINATTRGASGLLLEGTPAEGEYKALDPTAMTMDVLLGAAFGGIAHLNAGERARNPEALGAVERWAESLKPSDKDAMAGLRQAQHLNEDSLPGKPADVADIQAHVDKMRTAIEQLATDKPVEVSDVKANRTDPATGETVETEPTFATDPARAIDDLDRANYLAAEAGRMNAEQATDSMIPETLSPAYRDVVEQLDTLGQGTPQQRHEYAMLNATFFDAMAKRTGVPLEDLWGRFAHRITGEAPAGDAFAQSSTDTFYSELARKIDEAKLPQAPAKGWKDYIKGLESKGVKGAEIEATGVNEWLDLQQGKVTKAQVQEFLKNNGVQVQEVMLGGGLTDQERSVYEARERAITEMPPGPDAARALIALREEFNMASGGGVIGQEAKFSQWQLPGGQNYRELLLTLPEKGNIKELGWVLELPSHDLLRNGRGDPVIFDNEADAATMQRQHGGNITEWSRKGTDPNAFNQSHYDTPNVLAHIRFNERVDAERKRVLFIEEFQSDWAQKGKKEGFKQETNEQKAVAEILKNDYGVVVDPDTSIAKLERANVPPQIVSRWWDAYMDASHGAIPNAPFVTKTEAWVGLSMKRMIRYAAENGFDRIAWTRGEQQVERYTSALRKNVDMIEWTKTPEGVQIIGYKHGTAGPRGWGDTGGGTAVEPGPGRTKVVDTTEKETDLSDAIGKAMADQIRNSPDQKGTIEGNDIKVDDTGMATFYDRIVRNVASEIIGKKALGGEKVGAVEMNTINYPGRVADPNGRLFQPGFNITPAMRERALQGQPLFQGGQRGYMQTTADGQRVIGLLEHADASTYLHESGHFFLDVMTELASDQGAKPELKADITSLMDWMGVKDPAAWNTMTREEQRAGHEKFARGFEKYLGSGKAPLPKLQEMFDRFKDWLLDVYKSLANLNVTISPEVRGVMDRMLTGEPIPDIRAPEVDALKVRAKKDQPSQLLAEIQELGGIEREALTDITGESRTGKGVKGIPPDLFREGGTSLDDMASMLRQRHWGIGEDALDDGVQSLKDMIRAELDGERAVRMGQEGQAADALGNDASYEEINRHYNAEEEAIAEKYDYDPKNPSYLAEIRVVRIVRDLHIADMLSEQGDREGAAARRFVAENEGAKITVGRNEDGTPIEKTAREYLDDMMEAQQRAEEDSKLINVAAECWLENQ